MAVGLSQMLTITGMEGLENINLNGNTITITNYENYNEAPISFDIDAVNPTITNAVIQSSGENAFVAVDSATGITITNTYFLNNRNTNWIFEGGALFVETGNSIVEDCCFANNFANWHGGAICISDDDSIAGIDAFVTIRDTTFATADDTIYCEGEMTIEGGVSFAGNITLAQDGKLINNEVMILDLSARKITDGALINNWGAVSGNGTFQIQVAENQAFGKYLLAEQAGNFNGGFLVLCGDDSFDLSLANPTYEYNGKLYNLTKNNYGELAINIADLNAAKDDWTDRKENGANGLVDKSIGVIDENDIDKEGQDKQVFQNGYLGPDDPVDYLQFTINSAAKLNMEFETTGNAYFTLYTLNNNNELVYVSSTAATEYDYEDNEYEGRFYNLMLDANTYYIEAKAYSAVNYSIELEEGSAFFTKADDGKDNVLIKDGKVNEGVKDAGSDMTISISDWVGYGDYNDFYNFELTDAANLAFDITATGSGYNSLAFIIHKVDGETPWMYNYSVAYNWFDTDNNTNTISTDALLLGEGKYYIEVVNYTYDGCVDYNVAVNLNKSQMLDDNKIGEINAEILIPGQNEFSSTLTSEKKVEYRQFTLNSSGKLNLEFKPDDNVMFTILDKDLNYVSSIWAAADVDNEINGLMLEAGNYYIQANATWTANWNNQSSFNYTIEFEEDSVLFTKADDGKDNVLIKDGKVNEGVKDAGSNMTISAYSDWVGYGDSSDFYKFDLTAAAKISFDITATGSGYNSLAFIIHKVDGEAPWMYNYSVQYTWFNNSITTNALLLDKGSYYIEVVNYTYGGSVDYSFNVNQNSQILTKSNDNENDVLIKDGKVNEGVKYAGSDLAISISDWVGYGDYNDFYMFTVEYAGKYSFDITLNGSGYNSMAFIIHKVDGEAPWMYNYSIAYNWFDNNITTDALLLDDGTYYIEVVNYTYDGCADYTVAVNASKTTVFTDSEDEGNDVRSSNLALAGTVRTGSQVVISDGWVGYGDTIDYHRFRADSSMQAEFTISNTDWATLAVYDANGNCLWYASYGAGTSSTNPINLTAGKDYYVAVSSPYAASGADVDYDVTISRYIPKVTMNCDNGYYGNIRGDSGNDIITFVANTNSEFATIDLGDGNDTINIQDSSYYWDGGEIECFEVENADGTPGTIDLGAGNDTMTVGKTRELEALGIDMGSGDDKIILKADSMLEINDDGYDSKGNLVFGDGDDRLIIEAGNEWETELSCKNIDLGTGADYCEIGKNSAVDVYRDWNFGSGDDELVIEEGALICMNGYGHNMDFGDGDDTLELNGTLSLQGGTISDCENISGSGEVVFFNANQIDSDLEEKLLDAGINIVDGQGFSGCMGTASELADNDPFTGVEINDVEYGGYKSFWLCGSTVAENSIYGLADEVDYYLFEKNSFSQSLIVNINTNNSTGYEIEILDAYGNNTNYSLMATSDSYEANVSSWQNGQYLIKLSVDSDTKGNGSIWHM